MPRRSRSRSRSSSPRRSRRSRSYSRGKYSRSRSNSRDRHVSPSDVGYRIHIGDLVPDASEREIKRVFEKYGSLLEVWFARRPPCYAFVVFKDKEDAEEAVRDTDGKYICGVRVRVSHAKPRVRGGRRNMFGYGGGDSPPYRNPRSDSQRCFTCGETGHFARDCYKINRTNGRSRSRSRSKSRSRSRSRSYDRRRDRNRRSRDRSRERRRRSPTPVEIENGRSRGRDKAATSRRSRSRERYHDGIAAREGSGDETFD